MKPDRSLGESYWSADIDEPLLNITLGEVLRQAAREVPDRIALVDGAPCIDGQRRSWTYSELLTTAERGARALLMRFSPGDRIAVCAPNCPEWIFLQHSLHLAGLVLVPINPAYREAEVRTILQSAGVVGLFHVDEYRGNNLLDMSRALLKDSTTLRETFRFADFEQFLDTADPDVVLPVIRPDGILQLQYTSGTTGLPKGACLHHYGAVNTSRFVARRAGFPEGGVWLNAMPLFHIGGTVVTQIGTLALRGTYVIVPGFDAGQMLELIEVIRPDATLIVPTMILALLEHPDFHRRKLDSLKTILSGAATVPAVLVERVRAAFGCRFSILFGQTELNGVVSQTDVEDTVQDQSETLGRPLPGSEVAILDPETGAVQPIGAVGEICVRGYQAMLGYYGLEEETRQCIHADGWLHTGDLGTMDERGYLRFVGRLKDMIIRGGMNLYPREIEDVLFDHPWVAQVSVVGVPDERWGEIIGAVILPADMNSEPPWLELHNYCRERLAPHKTPALWFVTESFPLTPSGKVQKFQLQGQIARGELKPAQWERPISQSDN